MTLTLEDHERRIAALEKAAEHEKTVERAVAEIVSESERRLQAEVQRLRTQFSTSIGASERRVREAISAAQQETASQMNDFQQAVLAALDRLHNPPR